MTQQAHFHILHFLRFFRYGFLLCLIPMLQALLHWDLQLFYTALQHDAAILVVCAVISLTLWFVSKFSLSADCIFVDVGFFLKMRQVFSTKSIAAMEISRPIYCRILGASCVTLYFKNYSSTKKFVCFLSKQSAEILAEHLMPTHSDTSVFCPTGFERVAFIMLSANIVTASIFAWMSFGRLQDVLGDDLRFFAWHQISQLELLAAHWLPTGLSVFATIIFLLLSITFLYSFFRTGGFSVCRNGGVIISRGGFITKTERRIFVSCINTCDVRITPTARLLRRYPVYVCAGSFTGGDIPLMMYKKGAEHLPEALLPNFTLPEKKLCVPKRKSPMQYLALPGLIFVLSAALCAVAYSVLPSILPVLLLPLLFGFFTLLISIEAIFKEGICYNENRTISLCYTKLFTRHSVCVFTSDISYTLTENPLSTNDGRCNVTIHLPCRLQYKVRGILQYEAKNLPFTL